jgi:histidinol-phosphate phosphatase family protein
MIDNDDFGQDEIVLIMGYPSGGKSTIAKHFTAQKRFNRDEYGGSLDGLALLVEQDIKLTRHNGEPRAYVLDNTYATRKSRASILNVGHKYSIPVHCIIMDTSIEDAQYNAALRQIRKYGGLVPLDSYNSKRDENLYPPAVLFRYRNEFEQPTIDEGFASIAVQPFQRLYDPSYTNKALIVDYDGCLRTTSGTEHYPTKPEEVKILPRRAEILKQYLDKGYILLGVSNQSGIAKGKLTEADAIACFERTNELLGIKIDYAYCPHRVGPPVGIPCFCRKPLPGLGVTFIEKYRLKAADCIFVGDMATDKTFAERSGFKFVHSSIFFGDAQESIKRIKKSAGK